MVSIFIFHWLIWVICRSFLQYCHFPSADVTWIHHKGFQIHPYLITSPQRVKSNVIKCPCDTVYPFILYLRIRDIHTCFQAFDSGAVTTCFNNSGLSRPGIEPRSTECEANSVPTEPPRQFSSYSILIKDHASNRIFGCSQ